MGTFWKTCPRNHFNLISAPQIVELKAQLAEAEKTLKFATEKTTENQRRRAEEEAQDHEFLTGHGNKIDSVKKALEAAV